MKFLFGLGMVIATVGVILIYDARPITKKMFSFGDQNDGALGLKVTGFLIIVIGAILLIVFEGSDNDGRKNKDRSRKLRKEWKNR